LVWQVGAWVHFDDSAGVRANVESVATRLPFDGGVGVGHGASDR
jgi:hypothetical protein